MTAVAIVLVLLYVRHGALALRDKFTRDPAAQTMVALITEEELE